MPDQHSSNGSQTPVRWYNIAWRALRPFCIFLAALLICAALVIFGRNKVNEALISAPQPGSTAQQPFTVVSGSSLSRVSRELEEAGLIRSRTFFKYYCDFAGLGQKIQAGEYSISPGMDAYAVAELLTRGDGRSLTAEVTVIPGDTVEDIATDLKNSGLFDEAKLQTFLNICRTGEGVEDYYFIADEKKLEAAPYRKYLLEGYLSPDTYEIYTDCEPLTLVRKLLSQTDKVLSSNYQERMESVGMSVDQTLTLASLIEKEGKQKDFAKVSAVFHNRLKKGMKLESDPTVHYVTGVRRMNLNAEDVSLNSPYNTYIIQGLPVGPICNPSPAAIQAALWPDEGFLSEGYLYFCSAAPESGELIFSKTLEEHEAAVAQYRPLWQQYDEKRGIAGSR